MDEALLAAAREGRFTLRLYRWSPGCLSLGRNQPAAELYDARRAARLGIDVVRRPTGGRAVYHDRELTYSVTAPEGAWGGVRESCARIHGALGRGLARLGVRVESAGRGGPAPAPAARACFRDPLPGELVAGGRKLVGSAQWREGGVLLQHGSLLLWDDQRMAERLRCGGGEEPAARGVGLAELLGREPALETLCEAVTDGLATELGVELRPGDPSREELREACRVESRYRSPGWTWRR